MDHADAAKRCEVKAEQFRALARSVKDPTARRSYEHLTQTYEWLAVTERYMAKQASAQNS
jgi:hypothetical protein